MHALSPFEFIDPQDSLDYLEKYWVEKALLFIDFLEYYNIREGLTLTQESDLGRSWRKFVL